MANKTRIHMTSDSPTDIRLAPKHLTKAEFGRRLYQLMLKKGWNQSELARQADLPRDSVSTYVRGRSLPTPQSLKKLAEAIGLPEEELLPNQVEGAIDEDTPAFELKVSPNAPSTAWLRINRMVSLRTALKIADMLEQDNAVDGIRGGGTSKVPSDKN